MKHPKTLSEPRAVDTRSIRLKKMCVLLTGFAPLALGCTSPDRVMTSESVESELADSAQRTMIATDFEAPVDPDYLIGNLVPPFPPGVERLQASLVSNEGNETNGGSPRSADGRRQDEWILDFVRIGGRPSLLFSRRIVFLEPIKPGSTNEEIDAWMYQSWRIEDVALVPEFEAGDRIELSRCSDPEGERVVGLGPYRREVRTVGPVNAAWAIDFEGARLVETDPKGITCRWPFGPF